MDLNHVHFEKSALKLIRFHDGFPHHKLIAQDIYNKHIIM